MPLSETAATAVTERFQARLADIANRASTVSLRAWEQLGAWDRVDIDRFAAATADAFNAAQAAAVNTSAGYYALLADRPVTVPAVTTRTTSRRTRLLPGRFLASAGSSICSQMATLKPWRMSRCR